MESLHACIAVWLAAWSWYIGLRPSLTIDQLVLLVHSDLARTHAHWPPMRRKCCACSPRNFCTSFVHTAKGAPHGHPLLVLHYFPCSGLYRYTADLCRLQQARHREVQVASSELGEISTPLCRNLHTWRTHLQDHPDAVFAAYVLDGIDRGFRVGFDYTQKLRPAHRHMPSATQHLEVVDTYLQEELSSSRIVGPLSSHTVAGSPLIVRA